MDTGDGSIDNVDIDQGTLEGTCQNTSLADIIIGMGKLKINNTKYDWTFIKDLYEKQIKWGASEKVTTIVDKGLEVITKLGYPRDKYRIAPSNAPNCRIFLLNLEADNAGEGLQISGKLKVGT